MRPLFLAMQDSLYTSAGVLDSGALVFGLLEQSIEHGGLVLPVLPQVAVRVVRSGSKQSTNAQQLSDIINADRGLKEYVLRIAACAAKRPATPISSLAHAVAWLGFDEVSNIAFTLALQTKMLDVPGQQRKARRLWRHALASALWARQLALMLGQEAGVCYICGLLHHIGKLVALGAAHELARVSSCKLSGEDYDRLIDGFHRDIGTRVVRAWGLPERMLLIMKQCDAEAAPPGRHRDSAIVNVAHRLADYALPESPACERAVLVADPDYRALGLRQDESVTLFDSAGEINAELDRYLAP